MTDNWKVICVSVFLLMLLFLIPQTATARLMLMAANIAYENHINIDHFFKVIECESEWDPNARSGYMLEDGRFENSWGIAQFNLDTNQMTKDEALDPEFSLRKMAEYWSEGNMKGWKCFQLWEARNWK